MSDRSAIRGRVVMLVDNDVERDSRVQKQAKSAAERGWDVILIGKKSRNSTKLKWTIGDARVILISVPSPMAKRRYEYRWSPLRSPLAYPPGRLANQRAQRVAAWKADLRFRQALLRVHKPDCAAIRNSWLSFVMFMAKASGRWVGFRRERTIALDENRRSMERPIDRFTTWWWQRTMGHRAWRRLDPGIWDWEVAYGSVLDKYKPDIIHANDFRMLAVGARAATRAKARGRNVKLVWDAHEFLPGIKPWLSHPRWHLAQCGLEREFAPYADLVTTVTSELAELLVKEHSLQECPRVVFNAPSFNETAGDLVGADIRSLCGLSSNIPLFVYSGAAAPQRGLDVMIESLPELEGIHVALVVANSQASYVTQLTHRASELGVLNRLHLLPYVPVEEIVPFLSTADFGVIPVHHWPNHEISLGTKFFEYSHARLPILVSDVRAMAEMVVRTGQGEVFIAENLDDYIAAAKRLIADKMKYVKAYDEPGLLENWTWEKQADVLDVVYSTALSKPAPIAEGSARR